MPDEIRSVVARIDHLAEQVRRSDHGLRLLYELERAVEDLEQQTHLYLGLPPNPEGEYPYAFRRGEDESLVLVSMRLT